MKILLFLCMCVYSTDAIPQIIIPTRARDISRMETIDFAYKRVWYALNAIKLSDIETYDDYFRLDIGENISKFYSFFSFNSDSLMTDWFVKNPKAESCPLRMGVIGKTGETWCENYWTEIYKENNTGVSSIYITMPMGFTPSNSWYDDNHKQEWVVTTDTLSIGGYLCQKALCTFRGRDYIAWFTSDIPINMGPWKFGGLPGLILRVHDTNSVFCFEFTGIENIKLPINKYPYKSYKKMDRGKIQKIIKNIINNYSMLMWKEQRSEYKNIKYIPLELE